MKLFKGKFYNKSSIFNLFLKKYHFFKRVIDVIVNNTFIEMTKKTNLRQIFNEVICNAFIVFWK